MTARQKRNAIMWPIIGGVLVITFFVLCFFFFFGIQTGKPKDEVVNTYNVKYSSSEPVMEFVRRSYEETTNDSNLMYGYIYIDGEKVDIECLLAKRTEKIYFFHKGEHVSGEALDFSHAIFTAEYSLKGDTLTLKPYYDYDEYLVGEYKTIKLTRTFLDQN